MMFEEKWRFENHYLKAVIVNRKRVAKRNLKAQGYNVRKVISELYASFVLQCTVSGRYVNTRWMSQPDMGSILHIKNQ